MQNPELENFVSAGEPSSRRSEGRFQISAQVQFEWQTSSGERRFGKGVTRNMSANGIFVLAYPVPVPGASIELVVDVPSASGSRPPVRFLGRGQVVRIEPSDSHPLGFGASVAFEDEEGTQGLASASSNRRRKSVAQSAAWYRSAARSATDSLRAMSQPAGAAHCDPADVGEERKV